MDMGDAAARALADDLKRNAGLIELEQIDPRALIRVVTDINSNEFGFTNGEDLREQWESSRIQRVGPDFNRPPPGVDRVRCPDGRIIFIKFSSTKFQLLGDPEANAVAGEKEDMPEVKKKHNPPPKKTKPVKAAASDTKVAKQVKGGGSTKPSKGGLLTTSANRGVVKSAVKNMDLNEIKEFLLKSGYTFDQIWKALCEFFNHKINRPAPNDKWLLVRLRAQI